MKELEQTIDQNDLHRRQVHSEYMIDHCVAPWHKDDSEGNVHHGPSWTRLSLSCYRSLGPIIDGKDPTANPKKYIYVCQKVVNGAYLGRRCKSVNDMSKKFDLPYDVLRRIYKEYPSTGPVLKTFNNVQYRFSKFLKQTEDEVKGDEE